MPREPAPPPQWLASTVPVVTAALHAAAPRAARTAVLAIDGRSGSGKTTLATALRDELDCPLVTLEDLYGGWDGLEHGISLLVREVLQPLAAGRPAVVPRYDWTTGTWTTPAVLPAAPQTLIVEGVGAGARDAAAFTSLIVWMEAPQDTRRKRALDRDGELYEPFWEQWAAQEEHMLAREHTPDRAHIRIDTGGWEPPARYARFSIGRAPGGTGGRPPGR